MRILFLRGLVLRTWLFLGVLALPLLAGVAHAQQITGAFGRTLGEVVPKNAPFLKEALYGTEFYSFTPEAPHALFDEYTIIFTPKSRKIGLISAKKGGLSRQACRSQKARLEAELDKKYPSLDKQRQKANEAESVMFAQGPRGIAVQCTPEEGAFSLVIGYLDFSLQQQAEEER